MLKNLQAELNAFGKYVVQQSRSNLTKGKHNVTKRLYDSIKYDLTDNKGNYDLAFIMDEYGTFLDKGVKGADPSLVKGGKQKGAGSPYSYKNKMPPMIDISSWAKKRNIRLRDDKGRFKKGNYKAIGFIIQRSVFAQGIKPTLFFTKPFSVAFKRYPKLLTEAFAEDIIDILKQNNNGKN
mgnify:FL=1|jgi:hypothetical protein|tara:strand:- start:46 stop:585 length:540 start_codon:yes stop_codon:yes gene_type:complete